MKKIILTLAIVAITTLSYAQVAITTDGSTPDNSAMLDIKNTEKGILIPRMIAAERDAIVDPANGLLVYVTNDDSFYYNAGTTAAPDWKTIGDWSTFGPYLTYNGGNVGIGTNAANEKLTVDGNIRAFEKVISGYGSTNDAAYRFGNGMENTGFSSPTSNSLSIVNNGAESVRIKSNGNVGIGTSNPSSELEVAGQVKITGGFPGDGKILTSDADGLATWEDAVGVSTIDDLSDAKTNVGSVFLGVNAGINDDNINYNTGIGQNSLKTNTSGDKNTALGYASLYLNTTGKNNSAFGYDALNHNITGNRNTANGTYSLYSNETGSYNTAQGYGSMYKNTTGNSNIAIGLRTLYKNTDRNKLVAIGDSALFWNGTGATTDIEAIQNTAIGSKALNQNTTGYQNTAVGSDALSFNTTGRGNVAMGVSVMDSNTEGDDNTAIGNFALTSNESGEGNTALGNSALYHNIDADYNTAIGMQALFNDSTGIKNTATGFASLLLNKTGNNNVANGAKALYHNTSGHSNVAIGIAALYNNKTISNLVAIGDSTLFHNGSETTVFNEGKNNTAIGSKALLSNTKGLCNTASGYESLRSITTGSYNTANGCQSMSLSTTGSLNTAIGFHANPYVNFTNTTAIGFSAITVANNNANIGNSSVTWIGGQVPWSSLSKMSGKSNIKEDVKGLDFIMKLRPITYYVDKDAIDQALGVVDSSDYKEKYDIEKIKQSGFVAEEVLQASQKSAYEFSAVSVLNEEEGLYGISYSQFVVPLVKGMQEQQEMIDNYELRIVNYELEITDNKSKIEAVEKENQILKDRLDKLEGLLK